MATDSVEECVKAATMNGPKSEHYTPKEDMASTSHVYTELGHLMKGYTALGIIEIQHDPTCDDNPKWVTIAETPRIYPTPGMQQGVSEGWLLLHSYPTQDTYINRVRVFVAAEDVSKPNRLSLKVRRNTILELLSYISINKPKCLFDAVDIDPADSSLEHRNRTSESLFYIFNTLKSPATIPKWFEGSKFSRQALKDVAFDQIPGLMTDLYPYQKRSVFAMIQRECSPPRPIDPRKQKYTDVNGETFYLDSIDGILLKEASLYSLPRGGILAEGMGYGKTVISLAVILATRGHYPSIPEDRIDLWHSKPAPRTPTLLQMAARTLKRTGTPWKAEFHAMKQEGFHFGGCTDELAKYHRDYLEPTYTTSNPSRKGKRESARLLRLCYSTLVIVPANLLVQWQNEITKHTEADALDVLVIDHSTRKIPHPEEMMKYDVILISKSRFEQEYHDDDYNQARYQNPNSIVQSPLTHLRWLRVIVDEGHSFAGSTTKTNAMAMLDKLSIERKWVVSGTPSSSLHGAEVSLASFEAQNNSVHDVLEQQKNAKALEQEVKDIERLRLVVVNFLKTTPWANPRGQDPADWKKYLSPVDKKGIRHTSIALRQLMQSHIVRHRVADIETDLKLPPLYHKTVRLRPSHYDKLSLNLFVMVLTSNAVTSERTDEDYMHHPKNRKQLELLVSNLRQASFYWMGFSKDEVEQTLHVCRTYLSENIGMIPDDDAVLLAQAMKVAERALNDPGWLATSRLHDTGLYVQDFPIHATEQWSINGPTSDPLLLGSVMARDAQIHVMEQAYTDDPTSGLAGAGIKAFRVAAERVAKEIKNDEKKEGVRTATEAAQVKIEKKPPSKTTTTRKRSRASHESDATTAGAKLLELSIQNRPFTKLPNLPQTQITGFTSSKLTYLISELRKHNSSSKTLIFYEHANSAYFISIILDLIPIEHRIYASTLTLSLRAEYLSSFNTDPSIRIMLMDLKQASHGLHVAVASRVYFLTPVWNPSVEAQAIKRAHRIGQTHSVYVETLTLEGGIEEALLKRRGELMKAGGNGREVEKGIMTDEAMRGVVEALRFLDVHDDKEGCPAVEEKDKVAWLPVETRIPLFRRPQDTSQTDHLVVKCEGDPLKLTIQPGISSMTDSSGTDFHAEQGLAQKKRCICFKDD